MKPANKTHFIPAFFVISAFFCIVYGVYCYYSSNVLTLSFLYSADAIQIPFFAHNILYQHGNIFDWKLPYTPYFFPDMLIVMLISLFSKNIEVVCITYATLQMAFYVFVIGLLFKVATNSKNGARLAIISGLIALVLLATAGMQNELFNTILNSNYHMGGTLLIFIMLAFSITLLEKSSTKSILIHCGLIIITYVSDVLFALYFIAPVLATLTLFCIFKLIPIKRYLKFFSIITLTTILSDILYHNLPSFVAKSSAHLFHYKHIFYWIHQLQLVLVAFYHNDPIIFTLWACYFLLAPFSLVYYHIKKRHAPHYAATTFIILFEWITIAGGLIGMVLADPGLAHAPAYTGLRHAQPLILGPVFIGIPMLIYRHTNISGWLKYNLVYCATLTLLTIPVFIHTPKLNAKSILHYYPPELACIDQHAKQLHLHAGIGNYWQAKPFTAFNKTGFNLVAVIDDPAVSSNILPYHWINTLEPYRTKKFDFAIVNSPTGRLNTTLLYKHFGKPTSTFRCGNSYLIYVYKNKAMKNIWKSWACGPRCKK